MPCVKTKEWLMKTIVDFPAADIDAEEAEAIFSDKSMGTINFWQRIYKSVPMLKVSYNADNVLSDLSRDINMLGINRECNVYYYEKEDNIIFYDYQFEEEIKMFGLDEDLKDKNVIKMCLGDALSYFAYQDELN